MKDNKWHKGPPPSIGWWPASMYKYSDIYRWWDGEAWSLSATSAENSYEAGQLASVKLWRSTVYWKHRPDSWPERSKT